MAKAEAPMDVMAQQIAAISKGIKQMLAGRLNKRALLLLLSDSTGLSMKACDKVLGGLETLEERYLKSLKEMKQEQQHKKLRDAEEEDVRW